MKTTAQQNCSSSIFLLAELNNKTGGATSSASIMRDSSSVIFNPSRDCNISLSRLNHYPLLASMQTKEEQENNRYHSDLNCHQDQQNKNNNNNNNININHRHWTSSASGAVVKLKKFNRVSLVPLINSSASDISDQKPAIHLKNSLDFSNSAVAASKQYGANTSSLQSIRLYRNRVLLERANNINARTSASSISATNKTTAISRSQAAAAAAKLARSTLTPSSKVLIAHKTLRREQQENTCCILESRSRPIQAAQQSAPAAVTNSRLRQGALYARRQYHITPAGPKISASKLISATSLSSLAHAPASCQARQTHSAPRISNNKAAKLSQTTTRTPNAPYKPTATIRGANQRNSHATKKSKPEFLLYNNSSNNNKSNAARLQGSYLSLNFNLSSTLNANRSTTNLFEIRRTSGVESNQKTRKSPIEHKPIKIDGTSLAAKQQLQQKKTESEKARASSNRKLGNLASSTSSLSLAVVKKVKPTPSPQQRQQQVKSTEFDTQRTEKSACKRINQSYRRSSWSSCSDFSSCSSGSVINSSSADSSSSRSSISCGAGDGSSPSPPATINTSRLVFCPTTAGEEQCNKRKVEFKAKSESGKEEEQQRNACSYSRHLNGQNNNNNNIIHGDIITGKKKNNNNNSCCKEANELLASPLASINSSPDKKKVFTCEKVAAATAAEKVSTRANINNTTTSINDNSASGSGNTRIATNNSKIQQISVASGPQSKPKTNNNFNLTIRNNYKNCQMATNIKTNNNDLSMQKTLTASNNNIIKDNLVDNNLKSNLSFSFADINNINSNNNNKIAISDENMNSNNQSTSTLYSQREPIAQNTKDDSILLENNQLPNPLDDTTTMILDATFSKLTTANLFKSVNSIDQQITKQQQVIEAARDDLIIDQTENMPPPQKEQQSKFNSIDNNNSGLDNCNLLIKTTKISSKQTSTLNELNNNFAIERRRKDLVPDANCCIIGTKKLETASITSLVKTMDVEQINKKSLSEKNKSTTSSNDSIVDMQRSRTNSLTGSRTSLSSDDRMILGSPLVTPPPSELDLVVDVGNTKVESNSIKIDTAQKIATKEQKTEDNDEDYLEETASQNKKQKKDPVDIPIRQDSINDYYDLEAKPFARGKFAQVKRCINKITKKCFAAKCIKKRRRLVDIRHEILLEIEALKLSYHTNRIIRLYEVYETTNEIILILELAKGGELQRVLDDEELICEKLVKKMVKQILEGLIELHDNDIAHLDIKPQNLLLTESFPSGDIKLCDFGISRRITKDCEIREICGTPDYVAPEILRYDPISLATDMWSLGVLTYVLLSGYSPFGSENKQQTFCNITQATLDFPTDIFDNNKISKDAIDFMQKLIVRQPAERLTSRQAKNHSWLINE